MAAQDEILLEVVVAPLLEHVAIVKVHYPEQIPAHIIVFSNKDMHDDVCSLERDVDLLFHNDDYKL